MSVLVRSKSLSREALAKIGVIGKGYANPSGPVHLPLSQRSASVPSGAATSRPPGSGEVYLREKAC